ncbi:hypothetical protein PW52_07000 [Tamlana sedimentorum]|uniref:Lipoprotein n=1 Tax=Neotamlana sedimentorum TaxID=1435349 RepID=A0A0D7WF17_9FLAO|nr:hypothetical protein [Tamlana sedimentorum]KJD36327.1 hypothetical protein PW52_07000 [Tamlana sedimentorum]
MKNPIKLFTLITTCLLLSSCYSVRLRSVNGTYQPDPLLSRNDYYRGMEVVELDTVIKIDIVSKDFTYLIKETDACKSGKLHTVEFKNTFGGSLLSVFSFGKKRKLKVKYVCMKPTN